MQQKGPAEDRKNSVLGQKLWFFQWPSLHVTEKKKHQRNKVGAKQYFDTCEVLWLRSGYYTRGQAAFR